MADIDPQTVVTDIVEPELPVEAGRRPIPPNRPKKVYAGMWGKPEIGAVAAGVLAVIMALAAYFFWVIPSGNALARNRSEADRLESELKSAEIKYGEITNTETEVARIVESIDDFEARFLPVTSTGQAALYQRVNSLISSHGLINTTGPDYAPLEPADAAAGQQTEEEKGRSKFRSLYPGVYVSTTVEGSYQNIRRFIREIETGREFIVVSAVEIAPSDTQKRKESPAADSNAANPSLSPVGPSQFQRGFPVGPGPVTEQTQTQDGSKNQGKMHGETVSLHIELAAYFRRPRVTQEASER